MSQAYGVDTHLKHEGGVFIMMASAQGVAYLRTVLMATYTVKGHVSSIEEEASVRVDVKETQPQGLNDAVCNATSPCEGYFSLIEEGIAPAIPQVWIGKIEAQSIANGTVCGQGQFFPKLTDRFTAIVQAKFQFHLLRLRRAIGKIYQSADSGILMRYAVLHQAYAGRTVVEGRNTDFIGDDEMNVTVETAIHIEVPHEGHHVKAFGIIDTHEYGVVFPINYPVGNLEHKSTITTYMLTHVTMVDKNIGHVARPLKAKEKAFTFPFGTNENTAFVVTDAAFVI